MKKAHSLFEKLECGETKIHGIGKEKE